MKIWIISMECAGLIEAGGVKDVTHALCDSFSQKNNEVTLFIPFFGCTNLENIKDFKENVAKAVVPICGQMIEVTYSTARFVKNNAKIVFVNHLAYSEKKAVYVYTQEEEKENPMHIKGMGHTDYLFLDSLFAKAVAEYGQFIPPSKMPDIVHCQDASTALTPAFIEMKKSAFFKETKCVVTIHNAGPAYHHEFRDVNEAWYYTELPWNWISKGMNENRVEPFLISADFSALTTVSTFYAEEITNPQFNSQTDGLARIFHDRNIKITGITNGVDYSRYAPENPEISRLPYPMKPFEKEFDGKIKNRSFFLDLCSESLLSTDDERLSSLQKKYLVNLTKHGFLSPVNDLDKTAFFVYHGRLVWQKGIWVLIDSLNQILSQTDNIRFAVVGQGEKEIENKLQELAFRFPGKFIYFKGYNSCMARLSVAQADFALFPSNFEPCCLEDFIAQLFGTIPIANATGGLKKIIDGETGFLYSPNNAEELGREIKKALELKINDIETLKNYVLWASNYVREFYSWNYVSEKYLTLFKKLLKN